jgi:phenylacetate-CoA ligase
VVTPVHNKIWGLLRFGTGDLSSYIAEPCPCGRTAHRLAGILGRTGDAAKVRGMFVVTRQAEQVMAKFAEVARFQMVVTRAAERDELTLKAALKQDTTVEVKGKLAEAIGKGFQDACRIKPDKIEFLAGGTLPEPYQKLVDRRVWK